jgi:stage II sporulation protein D
MGRRRRPLRRWRFFTDGRIQDYYWVINIVLIMLIVAIIFPSLIVRGCQTPSDTKSDSIKLRKQPAKVRTPDIDIQMYHHSARKLITLPLEEYVKGVLSAEMPASFEMEALKAQAVAARTLAVRNVRSLGGNGVSCYKGADACDRHDHTQAWDSEEEQRKKWGSKYKEYAAKIAKAVEETRGEIITYKDEPIEVFFHSTSGGMTENVEDVFSKPLPYLRSVSSEGEEDAPHFKDQVTMTASQFVKTFKKRYPKAKLTTSNLKSAIKILEYSEGGRVKTIRIGGVTVKGTDVRKTFGLRSANFSIVFKGNKVIFNTIGYGHGVGMSQIGANSMAENGKNYVEILAHYYQNTDVVEYQEVMAKK